MYNTTLHVTLHSLNSSRNVPNKYHIDEHPGLKHINKIFKSTYYVQTIFPIFTQITISFYCNKNNILLLWLLKQNILCFPKMFDYVRRISNN